MACRQRHQLFAPAVEERVAADDERAGMQLDEDHEGGVDLAFGAGLQDMELHPLGARHPLHVFNGAPGIRIARVHEQGDYPGLGNQLGQQVEPLGIQLVAEDADAREVAIRRLWGHEREFCSRCWSE